MHAAYQCFTRQIPNGSRKSFLDIWPIESFPEAPQEKFWTWEMFKTTFQNGQKPVEDDQNRQEKEDQKKLVEVDWKTSRVWSKNGPKITGTPQKINHWCKYICFCVCDATALSSEDGM